MRIAYALILLCALAVFAGPAATVKLPLTKELQTEVPWFAFDSKEGVINNDNLQELVKQNKYRRVVFAFFATWCINCRDGLKKMSDSANELKKKGVLVVLVNVAEKDLGNYSRKKIEEWLVQGGLLKDEWLLVFDKFSNTLDDFGLQQNGEEAPLPRTLVTDENLRPLMLIGNEGNDYVQVLLSKLK